MLFGFNDRRGVNPQVHAADQRVLRRRSAQAALAMALLLFGVAGQTHAEDRSKPAAGDSPAQAAADDDIQSSSQPLVAYVSVSGDGLIKVFDVNAKTGKLTEKQAVEVGKGPGSLSASPDGRFLYAAIRQEGAAASLSIDPKTGKLTLLNKVSIEGSAAYVNVDSTGQYLLAAYYRDGKATVHKIGKAGRVIEGPHQTLLMEQKSHAILLDPTNRFAFVPHTGPNRTYQFKFDQGSGRLIANEPNYVIAPEGEGPRHYAFHPTLDAIYVVNELGSSMSGYHFDKEKGTVKEFQTLSTLPEGFEERNTCADVHITPNGRFVYGSNRGHNSIAGFSIDQETGKMTPIGRWPTEAVPREFDIDPTGRFLYGAGQKSGGLAAYRINADTGELTRFDTYAVGKGPAWVRVQPLPKP